MAALIPVGVSETIQAFIVSALTAKASEQATLDPSVNFYVSENNILPLDPDAEDFPLVIVWLQSLTSEATGSSAKWYQQETATFAIDCYAIGDNSDLSKTPDKLAVDRMLYLKEQVKHVILALINIDFGLVKGRIARRKWPNFQVFTPELKDTENSVAVGRWTFSVEYGYDVEDIETVDLSELNVSTQDWETLFTY